MKRRSAKSDPIERSMEVALWPGDYVAYRDTWDFVEGLRDVKQSIDGLVRSHPDSAVEHAETFIAGCYEKAEEIDDSGGSFDRIRLISARRATRQEREAYHGNREA